MKLKKGFVTYETDGQQLMVAAGPASKLFHGMVKSNSTAAFIIDRLKKDTTAEKIADALCENYDVSKEIALRDTNAVIDKLRSIGAVDE